MIMNFTPLDYLYLTLFATGVIATIATTMICKKLARKVGIMDNPQAHNEAHKGHAKSTPLLGGLAMFLGMLLVLIGVVGLLLLHNKSELKLIDQLPSFQGFQNVYKQFIWVGIGGFLAMLLGLLDDVLSMKASKKFFGQLIIATIAVVLGKVKISLFIDSTILTTLISIFWMMLLMNAINFFDNMDGLAVGTSAIAMALFAIIGALHGQYFVGGFAFLTTGVMLGFWIFNHNPASIFMGDSGSHFLGYYLAVISASVSYLHYENTLTKFPVLVPLLVLAIPLFDTLMVVIIRTKNRQVFWKGDHNHISHRFVKMGLNRKYAVMMVHMLALIIGLGSFVLIWGDFKIAIIVVAQMLVLLMMITIMQLKLGDTTSSISNRK